MTTSFKEYLFSKPIACFQVKYQISAWKSTFSSFCFFVALKIVSVILFFLQFTLSFLQPSSRCRYTWKLNGAVGSLIFKFSLTGDLVLDVHIVSFTATSKTCWNLNTNEAVFAFVRRNFGVTEINGFPLFEFFWQIFE